jgi:branched-subunit amino acid aminotransferase/4-amino-4-deoxychorismate lyase
LPLTPLFPDRKYYTSGVKTISVKYERQFPGAKTLNMLGSYLAYKKAKNENCYDALLIDKNENIIEGTRTNFFATKDDAIFTQFDEKILEGVTRSTVLYVAKKIGLKIEIKDIQVNNISSFDGAFLTSTSSKIVPIKQIDGFIFPTIPGMLKNLMKKYDEFLYESKGIFTEEV